MAKDIYITFSVTQSKIGPVANIYAGLKTGLQGLQTSGTTKMVLQFSPDGSSVQVFSDTGTELLHVGAKPHEEREKATPAEKPFKFSGRPSSTGWLRCEKLCELNLTAMQTLVNEDGHYLVYMDRHGQPLRAIHLPDVEKESRARASKAGAGTAISINDTACDMALGFLLEDKPDNAVALFVVARSAKRFVPLGKRLVESAVFQAYRPTTYVSGGSLRQSSSDYERARREYEAMEAGGLRTDARAHNQDVKTKRFR